MTLGWWDRKEPEANLNRAAGGGMTRTMLLACPLMFSCLIAAYSRNYVDSFETPAGSAAQDEVVLAYTPFVQEAHRVFRSRSNPQSREALLALAHRWDGAVLAGELQPLTPVSFEDNVGEGARSEIFQAKATLVSALLEDAAAEARREDGQQAADEALLAIRISESLKYSDFDNVYLSSIEQRRAAGILNQVQKGLTEPQQADVRNGLEAVQRNGQELIALTRFTRTQYYDWMQRMSQTPIPIEDAHRTVLVTNRVADDPLGKETLRLVRSSSLQAPSDGPEYFTELRMAWAAEDANQTYIKMVLAAL